MDDQTTATDLPRDVYLFFSDRAYARAVLRETWPDSPHFEARSIALFDFLYRWLPGMARDGHLVGTNWTGDLIGLEHEPKNVQAAIVEKLPADVSDRYRRKLADSK